MRDIQITSEGMRRVMLNRCAQQLGGFRLMRIGGKVVNTSPMPSDRGGGRRFARTIDLRR